MKKTYTVALNPSIIQRSNTQSHEEKHSFSRKKKMELVFFSVLVFLGKKKIPNRGLA